MKRLIVLLIALLLCSCGTQPVPEPAPAPAPKPAVTETKPKPAPAPTPTPSPEPEPEEETSADPYDSLTDADKIRICEYIQEQYDNYDKLEGRYTGDKYSDQIFEDAAHNYGLTVEQISIIWGGYYSYNAD